jgi:trimeric autotransporter adhesin
VEFTLARGGSAVITSTDGELVTLLSSAPSPPGSTLELSLEGKSFQVKVRGCKRQTTAEAGRDFRIEGLRSMRLAASNVGRPSFPAAPTFARRSLTPSLVECAACGVLALASAFAGSCVRPLPAEPPGTAGGSGGKVPSIVVGVAEGPSEVAAVADAGSSSPRELTYLKASNPGGPSGEEKTGDHFGFEIALSGDTLAVGAPAEDSGAAGVSGDQTDNTIRDSGAVYVFRRAGTSWTQEAYLKASNPSVRMQFGARIALDSDTLAVGAFFEGSSATGVNGNQADRGAQGSGAVYVFTRVGSTWKQQAYLKASNTAAFEWFGDGVALAGDTLAVGAPREDSGAAGLNGNQTDNSVEDSGAVYVFTRTGTTWAQQAYVKASNPGAHDRFGTRIALDADTLAVGAPQESSGATGVNGKQADEKAPGAGAVYVFTGGGSTWTQEAYLKASNSGAMDDFGSSLALSGDTLVVGAKGEDNSATGVNGRQNDDDADGSGAAYVFIRKDANWAQEAYLKASNTGKGDNFGWDVAVSGDRVIIGAPDESSGATGVDGNQLSEGARMSGAAYVFERTGATWTQTHYLKASNTQEHDDFGWSVGLLSGAVAVGAPREDSGATGWSGDQLDNSVLDSGAAYVFWR